MLPNDSFEWSAGHSLVSPKTKRAATAKLRTLSTWRNHLAAHGIMAKARFEWDPTKDRENQEKHGVAFAMAQFAFADPRRIIAADLSHGSSEKRYYCFGQVGAGVLTVRFTYRAEVIRIDGAGYWRKGKRIYERENPVHRRTPRRLKSRP